VNRATNCLCIVVVCCAAAVIGAAPQAALAGPAAEGVELLARQFRRALGSELVEFGGERATRELAERLIREGGEGSAARLGRIARASEPSTIRALRDVPATSLKYLDDVPDAQLVRAVGTLARPGVNETLGALGTNAARSAALRAEMRLPGAGARLVREFGDDAVEATAKLTDNQANQLLKVERVTAVRRLAPQQRRALLDTVAANPAAQVQVIRTAGRTAAAGVAVVAGGVVLWHATDVALAPTEQLVTHPDGTVERTTTSIGGQAAAAIPQIAQTYVPAVTLIGYAAVGGATLLGGTALLLRHRRRRRRQPVRG
jgi:hypothetical protein